MVELRALNTVTFAVDYKILASDPRNVSMIVDPGEYSENVC